MTKYDLLRKLFYEGLTDEQAERVLNILKEVYDKLDPQRKGLLKVSKIKSKEAQKNVSAKLNKIEIVRKVPLLGREYTLKFSWDDLKMYFGVDLEKLEESKKEFYLSNFYELVKKKISKELRRRLYPFEEIELKGKVNENFLKGVLEELEGKVESIAEEVENTELLYLAAALADTFYGIGGSKVEIFNLSPKENPDGFRTIFTLEFPFEVGSSRVYLNGLRQKLGEDYEEMSPDKIKFNVPPKSGDIIVVDIVKVEES